MKTQEFRVDVSTATDDRASSLTSLMQQWLAERRLTAVSIERVTEPSAILCRACFADAADANAFAAELGGKIVAEEEPSPPPI